MTRAEITAYQLGETSARVDNLWPQERSTHQLVRHQFLTPAQRQARDVLGPDLFWGWAQRGYDATVQKLRPCPS